MCAFVLFVIGSCDKLTCILNSFCQGVWKAIHWKLWPTLSGTQAACSCLSRARTRNLPIAVAKAAEQTGVASKPIEDYDAYMFEFERYLGRSHQLVHGLQDLHSQRIVLPRNSNLKPDPALLTERYERFLAAAGS